MFTSRSEYMAEWTDLARPNQVVFDSAGFAYVAELGYRAGRWPGTGDAEPGANCVRATAWEQCRVAVAGSADG